ncbi:hypothetical protein Pmar_PMAR018133, partial [Perkinsus marinus ATCC 50983]
MARYRSLASALSIFGASRFGSIEHGVQHCLSSMDSGLEAFSRNPADGSFAVLSFQTTALTKYLDEVFLS